MDSDITCTLQIVETDEQIEALILKSLKSTLDGWIAKVVDPITTKIRELFKSAILSCREVQSLMGGRLQAELGVSDSIERIDTIVEMWTNSIQVVPVSVRTYGTDLKGGFKLNFIKMDWSDVLNTPDAFYTTDKGRVIPWLEWLLLRGDEEIIKDYDVMFTSGGRTGLAIMVKGDKKRWHVPVDFMGTARDNFVTRALEYIQPEIEAVIETELNKQR